MNFWTGEQLTVFRDFLDTVRLNQEHGNNAMSLHKVVPGPGQQSVWDYPRPPCLEDCVKRIKVVVGGEVIAESTRTKRMLETSHPPVYYLPPNHIRLDFLVESQKRSFCEWKGTARYFDILIGEDRIQEAAWAYPSPTRAFSFSTAPIITPQTLP